MGVWIEIYINAAIMVGLAVTPCVGVWIEISRLQTNCFVIASLPAWECGLKFIAAVADGRES